MTLREGLHFKTGDGPAGTNKKGPDQIGAFEIHVDRCQN